MIELEKMSDQMEKLERLFVQNTSPAKIPNKPVFYTLKNKRIEFRIRVKLVANGIESERSNWSAIMYA